MIKPEGKLLFFVIPAIVGFTSASTVRAESVTTIQGYVARLDPTVVTLKTVSKFLKGEAPTLTLQRSKLPVELESRFSSAQASDASKPQTFTVLGSWMVAEKPR